jgi:hypothetical protein
MKKLLMLTIVTIIVGAGAAFAAQKPGMTAQAEAPATQQTSRGVQAPQNEAVPAPAPAPQKEVSPAQAPAASQPPVESAATPSAPVAPPEGFMAQQLSHKDFATMSLKDCADCHKGSGVAPTHGSDQMREHSFLARRANKNCVDCHDQQFCLDCHKGGGIAADLSISNYITSYVPKNHRTDFREIHPIKVLDNPQSCYKCHDVRYCSECHAKFRGEDLMIQSHRRAWSDLQTGNPGPAHSTFTTAQCQTCHPGGLLPKHVWSADHALEARRNLQTCQTCHSDGDVCMTCHSARQGLKVNPHPRGWSSMKDRYSRASGGRSCQKCHDNY